MDNTRYKTVIITERSNSSFMKWAFIIATLFVIAIAFCLLVYYIVKIRNDVQVYKEISESPCVTLYPKCTEQYARELCAKDPAFCDEEEFKLYCQKQGTNPDCTGQEFTNWCKTSEFSTTKEICIDNCESITYNTYAGYCDVVEYCTLIGAEPRDGIEICIEECERVTVDNQYLIGTCNSISFNYLCYENCLYSKIPEWCVACDTACLYPETINGNIADFTYCQILPEYKSISLCANGIDNIDCTPKMQEVYCIDNDIYCSYLQDVVIDDRVINTCDCQCLAPGLCSTVQYCKENAPNCK